jgi:hypothetical protein
MQENDLKIQEKISAILFLYNDSISISKIKEFLNNDDIKDEELIKFVINHMWSEIRANVITPKTWKLQVNNFGIFSPKEKKIEHFIAAVKAKGNESRLSKTKLEEFERILTLKTKQ